MSLGRTICALILALSPTIVGCKEKKVNQTNHQLAQLNKDIEELRQEAKQVCQNYNDFEQNADGDLIRKIKPEYYNDGEFSSVVTQANSAIKEYNEKSGSFFSSVNWYCCYNWTTGVFFGEPECYF